MALKNWKPANWFRKSYEQQNIEPIEAALDLNECPETNKLIANMALETLKPSVTMAMEQMASLARWLLATLVTINGGALVSLLSVSDKVLPSNMLWAASLFTLGIVLSIAAATLSALTSAIPMRTVGAMIGYWTTVADDGERLEEQEIKLEHAQRRTKINLWRNSAVGLLSLVSFVAGIVVVMSGFIPTGL